MRYNTLSTNRILSIDALRGITILVMIFVNELAGIRDIPIWMKHMPADADAMSFVDMVFPSFLFIVGMSIPFAINNRLKKGDSFVQLQQHIIFRTLGLLILGFFIVNAEDGYNEVAMGMSINLWALLFFAAVIAIWKVYYTSSKMVVNSIRAISFLLLVVLAFVYRDNNGHAITPQWWGILGLIGWAYLYACIFYQLCKGNIYLLIVAIVLCTGCYTAGSITHAQDAAIWHFISSQKGNAAHTSIVLCGMVVSLLFFEENKWATTQRRFINALLFIVLLLAAGYLLRPYFGISKIYATPTWCLYSAAACTAIFAFLYWLIDRQQIQGWTSFFKPAAANPLLTYIIPDIIYYLTALLGISLFPDCLRYGLPGLLWSAFYAFSVMGIVLLLNKFKIKLQL